MSNPIVSVTYKAKPQDHRCRYWCKVIPADKLLLPSPGSVTGASDVPAEYLRTNDDVELFEGDCVLEGEDTHHIKQRGWFYNLGRVEGGSLTWYTYQSPLVKAFLREKGDKEGLRGSGDVAAMIRCVRAIRMGYTAEPQQVQAQVAEAPSA